MKFIIIDFETRSFCNLLTAGTSQYVSHHTTDILCLCALVLENNEVKQRWTWQPDAGELNPELAEIIRVNDYDFIVAHNAQFDRGIWENVGRWVYDFPSVPFSSWYCSSAQCRVNALPASLDNATRALDAKFKKSAHGKSLIKQLCIPTHENVFREDPELIRQLVSYCESDVRAVAAILLSTRPMTPTEHSDYLINERINARGVRVDTELAEWAQGYAAAEGREIGYSLGTLTGGAVEKATQGIRFAQWILDLVGETGVIAGLMSVYKDGKKKWSTDKGVRADLLALSEHDVKDIEANYLSVIQEGCALFDLGSMSSVKKFTRMQQMASWDEDSMRVHGAFVYAGAGQTLRFSSRGLQLHNLRRDSYSQAEALRLREIMREGGTLTDAKGDTINVMDGLSKLIRPSIMARPGHKLIVFDWSQIEARVLPWLANSPAAESYLDIFREGRDVYTETAQSIGMDDRQIGKVMVLALGFGGGAGAFAAMAGVYGVNLPEHQVQEIIKKWRHRHDWAVNLWNSLESSATLAVHHPGTEIKITGTRISYTYVPDLMEGTLICTLPGGNYIQYPQCRLEMVETPWGERSGLTALKPSRVMKKEDKEWPRQNLWRGLLAENVTQALAAVILRNALKELENHGLTVIAHTHDEIICEETIENAEEAAKKIEGIMTTAPDFAEGLPLDGEAMILTRYTKK